ncbi:hypothetical protein GCM10008171_33190 [Methylopila jiangsuensis]|uniref:Uncharacterized protein n=1 Tax=Methylopila jiangsuensis TaxID=586230 RepID=A0A9W6JLL2_9HYPH|nr:hypothetical protein [Methylopila jiangsuensis]MDR6284547.1 hypothetical protein [Methylopila jiangsuensis]GLK78065.1 hypothetical protein GCM10008171_33190 [Methylopila jiangsuensis]
MQVVSRVWAKATLRSDRRAAGALRFADAKLAEIDRIAGEATPGSERLRRALDHLGVALHGRGGR